MDKTEKLIISGKSGSGKDFLLRKLNQLGYSVGVKTTTRPKRQKECDGIDYIFETNQNFKTQDMIVWQEFKNHKNDKWLYGFDKNEFGKSNIFIMTPGEIEQLNSEIRENCFVVYLDIEESIRRNRLSIRKDNNDSIERRLQADNKDFENFNEWDLKITDPEFSVEDIISLWD